MHAEHGDSLLHFTFRSKQRTHENAFDDLERAFSGVEAGLETIIGID